MPNFRLCVMNYLGKILVTYLSDNVTLTWTKKTKFVNFESSIYCKCIMDNK